MFDVDDAPMETLHIYLEREEAPKPSLLPIFLSVLALSLLVALSVLSPAQQPVTRAVIRVPAVLLPITIATDNAHVSPAAYILNTDSGISIATDQAVFVPAGTANGYGYATVNAHAAIPGTSGNIPALAIDTVIGSSGYVRNLAAFTGGRNASSVAFVTASDTQRAVTTAHHLLAAEATGLHYPCLETIRGPVIVTWRCQFVTYHILAYMHATEVTIIGKNLLLAVWFVARPVHIWVK